MVRPAFDMYAITVQSFGGTVVDVMPREDFEFPVESMLRRSLRGRAWSSSPARTTRPASASRNDDIAKVAGSVPADAIVFVDEAYHDFCGDTVAPTDRHASAIWSSAARSPRRHGLAALRVGALMGSTEAHRCRCSRVRRPTASTSAAAAGLRAALADDVRLPLVCEPGAAVARAVSTEFCDSHGIQYWPSGANFVLARVGDRRGADRGGARRARGIYIRNKTGDPGCDGCIRDHHRRRRAHASAAWQRWRSFCAARGDRSADDRDADPPGADAGRARALLRCDGHPVPRSHAGALRPPWRVRPRRRRRPATSMSISITLSRISASPSAKRCRRRSGPPRHQSRRLLRHADGRDAGGGRDRSRRPAARGRRPELRVAARRRPAGRAGARLLRGLRASARARTSTSRCSTDARATTTSRRCSRRSPARCASPARRTAAGDGRCRAPRGCCDGLHDLRPSSRYPSPGSEVAGMRCRSD